MKYLFVLLLINIFIDLAFCNSKLQAASYNITYSSTYTLPIEPLAKGQKINKKQNSLFKKNKNIKAKHKQKYAFKIGLFLTIISIFITLLVINIAPITALILGLHFDISILIISSSIILSLNVLVFLCNTLSIFIKKFVPFIFSGIGLIAFVLNVIFAIALLVFFIIGLINSNILLWIICLGLLIFLSTIYIVYDIIAAIRKSQKKLEKK